MENNLTIFENAEFGKIRRYFPENRFTSGNARFDNYVNTVFKDIGEAQDFIDILKNHPKDFHPSMWHFSTNKEILSLSTHIFDGVSIESVTSKEHGITYSLDLQNFVTLVVYSTRLRDIELKSFDCLDEIEYLGNVLIENEELRNCLYSLLTNLRMRLIWEQILLDMSNVEYEYSLYPIWNKVCREFGYTLVSAPKKLRLRPDSWVAEIGSTSPIPVEMKLHDFDHVALQQIENYMKQFECSHGIAIGAALTCKLPDNIRFISIKELKDAQRKED